MAGEPTYIFDPFKETGVDVPAENRREALEAAADYVKEQILLFSGEGKTSVAGGLWKRGLSPEYKEEKAEESSVTYSNVELTGDMMDALEVEPEGERLRVEITGDQRDKAEGNLLGSYGREPNEDKAREFMPHKRGQHFRKEIIDGLRELLESYGS